MFIVEMRIQPETTQTVQEVEDDDTGRKRSVHAVEKQTGAVCFVEVDICPIAGWLVGTAPHDDNEAAAEEEWRGEAR